MLHNFVFWSLLPFAIPQAYLVRKNAVRFAGAAGATSGTVGTGQQLRLLAIGDSIIAGVGATNLSRALIGQTAQALAKNLTSEITWQAHGKIGAKAQDIWQEIIPDVPATPTDFIVISVGVNDVTALTSLAKWRQSLHAIIAALQKKFPHAIIAFAGVPPMQSFPLLPNPLRFLLGLRSTALDKIARHVVTQYSATIYVPFHFVPSPDQFAADGYHPSENGYQEFGKMLATEIYRQKIAPE